MVAAQATGDPQIMFRDRLRTMKNIAAITKTRPRVTPRPLVPIAATLLIAMTGCFTTSVYTPGAVPAGPEYSDRQWFTLGGLVTLSDPAGLECKQIAYSESEHGLLDMILSVGVSIVGGAIGAGMCADQPEGGVGCAFIGGWMAPALLESRTVRYRCAAAPAVQVMGVPMAPAVVAPVLIQAPAAAPVPIPAPAPAPASVPVSAPAP